MLLYISAGQGTIGESSHQNSQRGTVNRGNKGRVFPGVCQSEMTTDSVHAPAGTAKQNCPGSLYPASCWFYNPSGELCLDAQLVR